MTTQTTSPAQGYEDYFGPAIFQPLSELTLAAARPRPGEVVLDVACGTGIVVRNAAAMIGDGPVDGGRFVGADVNPAMLEVARAVTADAPVPIEWRRSDASDLALPDASFDLVLCQQGLQFFPDRGAALREMHRVLQPGGRATLTVWQGLDHHPLYAAMAEVEARHLSAFGHATSSDDLATPFSLGDADAIGDLLTDAGFIDVEIAQGSIVARFATPDRFIERLENAYAAVVPGFAQDPDVFAAYLDVIERETQDLIDRHRDGDHIAVPMHTNIVTARV